MNSVRDHLDWFLELNRNEQWISTDEALKQLESWGNGLISGLVECLEVEDAEIRQLAVTLLAAARPRSDSAVPDLIRRLDDDDRLVRVAAAVHIEDFGPIALGAIPFLERWLENEDEYLRTLALTRILLLDPFRSELMPDLKAAQTSDFLMVRCLAREFFGKTKTPLPFNETAFQETLRGCWFNHSPTEQVWWRCEVHDDGTWQIEIAPVFQEVLGGPDDGLKVWPAFQFDVQGFSKEPGVEITSAMAKSRCSNASPSISIHGKYFGESFSLTIFLEPKRESEIREIIDVNKHEVRPFEKDDDEIPF